MKRRDSLKTAATFAVAVPTAARTAATAGMQARAMAAMPHVPPGAFLHPNGWWRTISGVSDAPVLVFHDIASSG